MKFLNDMDDCFRIDSLDKCMHDIFRDDYLTNPLEFVVTRSCILYKKNDGSTCNVMHVHDINMMILMIIICTRSSRPFISMQMTICMRVVVIILIVNLDRIIWTWTMILWVFLYFMESVSPCSGTIACDEVLKDMSYLN